MSSASSDELDGAIFCIARASISQPFYDGGLADPDLDAAVHSFELPEGARCLEPPSGPVYDSDAQYIQGISSLVLTKPALNSLRRYVIHRGTGFKRGPGKVVGSAWKKRCFVLLDDLLVYAEAVDSPLLGAIPLRGAEVEAKSDDVIVIHTKFARVKQQEKARSQQAKFFLRFPSESSRWQQLLRAAISTASSPDGLVKFRQEHPVIE